MNQTNRARLLSPGRGERQSGLPGYFRQVAVALSIGVLLAGAVGAAPQRDEESKKAKAEMKIQKAAEKQAKIEKKAKSSKASNPTKEQIANTPKGTYLPGQFSEQERKAVPAVEVKQF